MVFSVWFFLIWIGGVLLLLVLIVVFILCNGFVICFMGCFDNDLLLVSLILNDWVDNKLDNSCIDVLLLFR